MSEAGSQWWPPEAESENGQSSGTAQVRRPNPILTPDQRQPTPDVAAVLAKTARLGHGNGSSGTRKTTVELPLDLWAEVRSLARGLSNHGRRGYSAFVAACLRYAVDAYKKGEWEIIRKPRVAYYDLEIARKD